MNKLLNWSFLKPHYFSLPGTFMWSVVLLKVPQGTRGRDVVGVEDGAGRREGREEERRKMRGREERGKGEEERAKRKEGRKEKRGKRSI